jgi:DNA topoisomerase-6 subunit B
VFARPGGLHLVEARHLENSASRVFAQGFRLMADNFRVRSPAEFFAENKNIAGFDNDGRSLYTTVRELVENGLDAAEAAEVLPSIRIRLEELRGKDFQARLGLGGIVRRDFSMYKDFHEQRKLAQGKAAALRRKKRRAPNVGPEGTSEPADEPQLEAPSDGATLETCTDEAATADAGAGVDEPQSGDAQFFIVSVQDNGTGIEHERIPQMFGIVLAGTKYSVQQSRGKFGLGSKMALLWSKMSTGLPIRICSSTDSRQPLSLCMLDIDIARNKPRVLVHKKIENAIGFRGTEVSVTIRGNWKTYRTYILQYLRHMAIITPYAEFFFSYRGPIASKNFDLYFARRSDCVPPQPTQVKHHPSSVNQLVLQQLMNSVPASTKLIDFLANELSSISRDYAKRLVCELGCSFSEETSVAEVKGNMLRHLLELLRQAHFLPPSGDCLSPAGEYNLRLGIIKELSPEIVATHTEPVGVLDGHPFIVEVGVSFGGAKVKPGINVFRFANRIPLLFEGGNDVVTRTATKLIPWTNYKINPITDRVGVFCSIVSTRCPFKGTGKEYIGADAEPIQKSVRHAIMQCCQQLRIKLVRKSIQQERQERKKRLSKYVPHVARAIHKVLLAMANHMEVLDGTSREKDHGQSLLAKVQAGLISESVIGEHLMRHVAETEVEEHQDSKKGVAQIDLSHVYPGILPPAVQSLLRPSFKSAHDDANSDDIFRLHFLDTQKASTAARLGECDGVPI